MELINKNAVIGSLNVIKEIAQGDLHMLIAVKALIETINEIPAVDAVPVIRCRDCKHYYVINEVRGNCSEYNFVEKIPIDYCSWAERKEE